MRKGLLALLALTTCGGQAVIDDGGQADCEQLEHDYAEQLQLARTCLPPVSSMQCTLQVDDGLACPCWTFVNPANEEAVTKLAQLEAAWSEKGCEKCATVHCAWAGPGFCEPAPPGSGVEALCVDQR